MNGRTATLLALKLAVIALLTVQAAFTPNVKNPMDIGNVPVIPETVVDDSKDPIVQQYQIFQNKKDRENNNPLVIENTNEFHQLTHEYRVAHELKMEDRALSNEEERQMVIDFYASVDGKDKDKVAEELRHLKAKKCTRPKEWIKLQVGLFEKAKSVLDMLSEKGLDPPRKDWTKMTGTTFQTFCAAIATAGTSDVRLFAMIMALRKLGIFDMETLADYDVDKLQNVLLYIGFNHWSYTAAKLVGCAKIIRDVHGGKIPINPKDLFAFNGISRKIFMIVNVSSVCVSLLFVLSTKSNNVSNKHDVFHEYSVGIVWDTHVHTVCGALKWSKFKTERPAAREVEGWLPNKYFFDVNLVFVSTLCSVTDCRSYNVIPYKLIPYERIYILPIGRIEAVVEGRGEWRNLGNNGSRYGRMGRFG